MMISPGMAELGNMASKMSDLNTHLKGIYTFAKNKDKQSIRVEQLIKVKTKEFIDKLKGGAIE